MEADPKTERSDLAEAVVYAATRWHVFKTLDNHDNAAAWLTVLDRTTEAYLWYCEASEYRRALAIADAEREVQETALVYELEVQAIRSPYMLAPKPYEVPFFEACRKLRALRAGRPT
jgi:hypothetical protein